MKQVEIHRGDSPVVLGLPHTGTLLPDEIYEDLNLRGQTLADTDWHIHRLYEGLLEGATSVRATFHRYVVDANRNPTGDSLYPGQNTTGLVPLTDFDGEPIWQTPPDADDIEQRRKTFHAAYHAALEQEILRIRDLHGVAILYDCHSIRSHIPYLFEGTLPDFNIGTNEGTTCAEQIEQAVADICSKAAGYSSVSNGRFKGGWTTRHYGRPVENIHAVQMELAQSTHLKTERPPFDYDPQRAERLRIHLKSILETLAEMAPELGASA